MEKFNVGDEVICIRACDPLLHAGQYYTVDGFNSWGEVKVKGTPNYWVPSRFEIVSKFNITLPSASSGVPMPEIKPAKTEELDIPSRKPPEKQLLEIKYAGMTVTLDLSKLDSKKFAEAIIDAIYEQGE